MSHDQDVSIAITPRVYLDQNILSEIAKGTLTDFKKGFETGQWQLVYWGEMCRNKKSLQNLNVLQA